MAGQGLQQSLLCRPEPLVVRLSKPLMMRQPTDSYQKAKVSFYLGFSSVGITK